MKALIWLAVRVDFVYIAAGLGIAASIVLLFVYLHRRNEKKHAHIREDLGFSLSSKMPDLDAEIFRRGSGAYVDNSWRQVIHGWTVYLGDISYSVNHHHRGISSHRKYVLVLSDRKMHLPYFRILGSTWSTEGENPRVGTEERVEVEIPSTVVTFPKFSGKVKKLLGAPVANVLQSSSFWLCAQGHNDWVAVWAAGARPSAAKLPQLVGDALKLADSIRSAANP